MGWLISVIQVPDDRIGFVPGHEQILRELGWTRHGEATTITIHDHIRNHKDAA